MLKINSKTELLRKEISNKKYVRILYSVLNPFLVQISNSQIKKYFFNLQQKLLFMSTVTKTRSICILTGRSRSVYRTFRVSRLKLRHYANEGYFVGLSKASW